MPVKPRTAKTPTVLPNLTKRESNQLLSTAIDTLGADYTRIALGLGLSRYEVVRGILGNRRLREQFDSHVDPLAERAYLIVTNAVLAGDLGATKWWLKRFGASRGYGDSREADRWHRQEARRNAGDAERLLYALVLKSKETGVPPVELLRAHEAMLAHLPPGYRRAATPLAAADVLAAAKRTVQTAAAGQPRPPAKAGR